MCIFWKSLRDRLRLSKDPYGIIGHKEIKLILSRIFHMEKREWTNIILGAEKRGIIEFMGQNQIGCIYKVN